MKDFAMEHPIALFFIIFVTVICIEMCVHHVSDHFGKIENSHAKEVK